MLVFQMLDQLIISVFGVMSCYCTATKNPKWACIWGMCAEPGWVYTSYTHQQWGILFLAFVYCGIWGYGIYNCWIKK